jgi:hypothetical protein
MQVSSKLFSNKKYYLWGFAIARRKKTASIEKAIN